MQENLCRPIKRNKAHPFAHTIFHTQLCHTPSFTHNFVTHHLSHTTFVTQSLSHTPLSHNLFHTQLCHTLSLTHNFVTHSLSHTTWSHTIFHTQLCHTHSLSHTTLSHTLFSTQLCHTLSFTHNLVTHHLSHTTFHTQLCHTPSFTHTIYFAWQAWHLATSTCTLRGRHGAYDTVLAPVARLVAVGRPWRRGTLRGRRGTSRHLPSLCVAGVAV